jgi:hypothetical protein
LEPDRALINTQWRGLSPLITPICIIATNMIKV